MMPGARSAGGRRRLVEQDRIGPWAATGLCSTNPKKKKRTYLLHPQPPKIIPARLMWVDSAAGMLADAGGSQDRLERKLPRCDHRQTAEAAVGPAGSAMTNPAVPSLCGRVQLATPGNPVMLRGVDFSVPRGCGGHRSLPDQVEIPQRMNNILWPNPPRFH